MPLGRGWLVLGLLSFSAWVFAQDGSTGLLRGRVLGPGNVAAAGARVTVVYEATGFERNLACDASGDFVADLLPPGDYTVTVRYAQFAPFEQQHVHVDAGVAIELPVNLIARQEQVNVSGEAPVVDTQSSAVNNVIPERAIDELPLNGRRFQDLALLTPGVTQDPRGLTSASNGDLAFGGLRGFHTTFLVDGSDDNNSFFAQARGRYRAPYQFSNDVIQEFTVSTNSYGAELGGAGAAVINVVTKSGSNFFHGDAFYYLRDSTFDARPPFVAFKPSDQQHQFGFTFGGPIKKDKAFFFAGFDQHLFHIPEVVEFLNGASVLTPIATNGVIPGDYEASDKSLVFAAAAQLDSLAGEQGASLIGNAGFAKVDVAITPREYLSARVNTSRYYDTNNIFFDPASPIVNSAQSANGDEDVSTASASVALTSALSARWTSHLRAQFSRDDEASTANSSGTETEIPTVLQRIGRDSILPRDTNEQKVTFAETMSHSGGRNTWKIGGELGLIWIRNYFPGLFSGEYIFDPIKVNPFTFVPQIGGLDLTPLRAYAHEVPKYYDQNFGAAVSHPDSHEYALFVQDAIRVTNHLALNMGARYDLQTFRRDGLIGSPLWPQAGKVPTDANNLAPRAGFAYSIGNDRPVVVRGGGGIFFTTIPQLYTSAIETQNGVTDGHVFLNHSKFPDNTIFPLYPNPLVGCTPGALVCAPPAGGIGITSDVSAFASNFQTPYVEQANLSVEKEVGKGIAVEANYLFVHGVHLVRARDVNLPKPVVVSYPVFDDTGANFLGTFYNLESFSTLQFTPTFTCPFPPCINPLDRPISQLGAINEFESEASSIYHGLTVSARRHVGRGFYFQISYTLAHAIDDNQDALINGQLASQPQVQNSSSTSSERANSVTDQRNRLALSWVLAPHWFHREHQNLGKIFNNWKLADIFTYGSGRPVDARVLGDANADGNEENDRLPGVSRNSYLGPDYASADLRVSRTIRLRDRWSCELLAESFNLFNRDNQRLDITDNGFTTTAAQFVQTTATVNGKQYPAQFQTLSSFLKPTSSYAPRQVQFALKVKF